jgi:glycosyltransferase involved in cell wall biosynthesis
LPTYNEKENLPIITYLIFEMAEKNNLNFEIVIIDDNSPDGMLFSLFSFFFKKRDRFINFLIKSLGTSQVAEQL